MNNAKANKRRKDSSRTAEAGSAYSARHIALSGALVAITLAFIFTFSVPAYAQSSQCLSAVDGTSSISNATTGTNVVVSVTTSTSESSCTVSTLLLEYSPNTLTVADPSSGQYSSFSAGSTKSFTVTAGTAGVYTITSRGTTSSGSVSDNSPVVIEFVNPSTLAVSGLPSSASVPHRSTTIISINITNSQSSAITTSYALNLPSGFTKQTGDELTSSSLTVGANSQTSRSWTINHSSCTTGSKTVTFDLGSSTSVFSSSITANSTCDTVAQAPAGTGGGAGGGGAGGNATNATKKVTTTPLPSAPAETPAAPTTPAAEARVTVERGKATISIPEIAAGRMADVAVERSEETGVRRISISVKNAVRDVQVTITKLDQKPVAAAPSGQVFAYLDISAANLQATDIDKVMIDFDVDKSWLAANNIDTNSVALARFAGSWVALKTAKTGETDSKVMYQAESPGFSSFAVVGQQAFSVNVDPYLMYFIGGFILLLIAAYFYYHVFKPKRARSGKYEYRANK